MIRKVPSKINKNPTIERKNQINQQSLIIPRKKSFTQNQNQSYFASLKSTPSKAPKLNRNIHLPLQELNCLYNNQKNQPNTIQRFQKHLKSQNSLNDLSAIAPVEMSSSSKKDIVSSQLEFMQNFDKICKESMVNYNYKNTMTNKNQKIQFSIHDNDDFEILDIYSTTFVNLQQSNNDKKIENLENTRRTGGIKRNSQSFLSKQLKQLQKLQFNSIIRNPLTYSQIEYQLTRQYDPSHKQKSSIPEDFQKQTKQTDLSLIKQSTYKLFDSISQGKMIISQNQIQNFPLNCQIKLLLGPIITKLRQKKYSYLKFSEFYSEFLSILADFSQTQKNQICHNIINKKFIKTQHQNQFSQQKDQKYFYPPISQKSYHHKKIPSKDQQTNFNSDKLTLLNSKVDTYLSRISQKYDKSSQLSKKQKLSTLMSRLTQIEEISGDSDDLISKDDSESDQKRQICPNKNVYVNDVSYFQDLAGIKENERFQKMLESQLQQKRQEKQMQQQHYFSSKQLVNHQRDVQSRILIQNSYPNSLNQSRQIKSCSYRSGRFESIQFQDRKRHLFSSFHKTEKEDTFYPTSLRSINLSFNELQKYLQ